MVRLPSVRTAAVPRRCSTSSGVSPPGRLPVRSHRAASGSAWTGAAGAPSAGRDAGVALAMKRMIRRPRNPELRVCLAAVRRRLAAPMTSGVGGAGDGASEALAPDEDSSARGQGFAREMGERLLT